MSKIVLRPLKDNFIDALIDGETMRAEERGEEIGIDRKEEKIIKKLLKTYSPENIALTIECDLEKVWEKKINAKAPSE